MAGRCTFDIIVADGFTLTELAGIVDVLRVANRISTKSIFTWQFRSAIGGPIRSSSEAVVETEQFVQRPDVDYVFVIGNKDPNCAALSLGKTQSHYTNRQARVILLAEAASRYIADHRDAGTKHTTHWENRDVLREQLGLFDTNAALIVDQGAIITCAGMGATVDVALSIVSQYLSAAAMMTVADIMLHERIRHQSTLRGQVAITTGDRALDACVALMQDNIEYPLPIARIAMMAQLSKRSMERKFRQVLRTTPNGYYKELRLTKANNLLLNTDMRISDIGLACGFGGGFSGIYKDTFGLSPNAVRKKGRS